MIDTWELDKALPNFSDKMFEEGKEQRELTKSQKIRNAWARSEAELEYELELSTIELEQEQAHGIFWPNFTKDVADYCRTCAQCQETNPRKLLSRAIIHLSRY